MAKEKHSLFHKTYTAEEKPKPMLIESVTIRVKDISFWTGKEMKKKREEK